jgi:hypothetical protein
MRAAIYAAGPRCQAAGQGTGYRGQVTGDRLQRAWRLPEPEVPREPPRPHPGEHHSPTLPQKPLGEGQPTDRTGAAGHQHPQAGFLTLHGLRDVFLNRESRASRHAPTRASTTRPPSPKNPWGRVSRQIEPIQPATSIRRQGRPPTTSRRRRGGDHPQLAVVPSRTAARGVYRKFFVFLNGKPGASRRAPTRASTTRPPSSKRVFKNPLHSHCHFEGGATPHHRLARKPARRLRNLLSAAGGLSRAPALAPSACVATSSAAGATASALQQPDSRFLGPATAGVKTGYGVAGPRNDSLVDLARVRSVAFLNTL